MPQCSNNREEIFCGLTASISHELLNPFRSLRIFAYFRNDITEMSPLLRLFS